jgi:hypothetical protein
VLVEAHACAAQVLRFYAKLTDFQKDSYLQLQSFEGFGNGRSRSVLPPLDEIDRGPLMARDAPASLAEFARLLDARGPVAWGALLREFWPGSRPTVGAGDDLESSFGGAPALHSLNCLEYVCARTFLQPYAEFLAADGSNVAGRPLDITSQCGLSPLQIIGTYSFSARARPALTFEISMVTARRPCAVR